MLDFPNSPVLDQIFVVGDVTWRWDGGKWVVGEAQGDFVLKAGDAMSGPLQLPGLGYDPGYAVPIIWIGPRNDTDGLSFQKSFEIHHNYNYTGSPSGHAGQMWVAMPFRIFTEIQGNPGDFIWSAWIEQSLRTTSGTTSDSQHGGLAVTSRRHSGATPYFLFYGEHVDQRGLPATQTFAQSVGFELDLLGNGPEPPETAWYPGTGGRVHWFATARAWQPPIWTAGTAYAKDQAIWPKAGDAHVYVCTVAGTSGATPPTWPTSGPATFTDGTITWMYGTTYHMECSRAFTINSVDASFGAGLLLSGTYYDAPIDMSSCVLDYVRNPNACGLRMAAGMNIDFTGGMTQTTQNLHRLGWEPTTQRLYYATGAPLFSIGDDGSIRMIVPTDALDDTTAAAAGIAVGGIYRKGSQLMVRVT